MHVAAHNSASIFILPTTAAPYLLSQVAWEQTEAWGRVKAHHHSVHDDSEGNPALDVVVLKVSPEGLAGEEVADRDHHLVRALDKLAACLIYWDDVVGGTSLQVHWGEGGVCRGIHTLSLMPETRMGEKQLDSPQPGYPRPSGTAGNCSSTSSSSIRSTDVSKGLGRPAAVMHGCQTRCRNQADLPRRSTAAQLLQPQPAALRSQQG